jgi:hypothetical protein
MPDEWHSARGSYEPAKLVANRCLADAGLADQHDHCAATSRGSLESCLQLPQLALTANESRPSF